VLEHLLGFETKDRSFEELDEALAQPVPVKVRVR
jgi:hypothetical protein